jgi:DNA-binding transcriptional LysR family regulator
MEMHEIKYFLAACRTLNFHRAAELSHVSQPALTRAIQKLEAELGGHLFHRERSQIRLTDFGRLMRSLDIALMAQPNPFDARLDVVPIFWERFGLAFPVGHRFEQRNTLHVTDVRGENYLSRINCEYRDYLGELCSRHGVEIRRAHRSEREDWIMAMVAAGMGICFLPEFSAVHPGVRHRLVAEPEVVREVSLVSVAGRTFSPAISAFVKAVRDMIGPPAPPRRAVSRDKISTWHKHRGVGTTLDRNAISPAPARAARIGVQPRSRFINCHRAAKVGW